MWLLDGVDGWVALVAHFTTASFWLPGGVFHCIVIDACCLRQMDNGTDAEVEGRPEILSYQCILSIKPSLPRRSTSSSALHLPLLLFVSLFHVSSGLVAALTPPIFTNHSSTMATCGPNSSHLGSLCP